MKIYYHKLKHTIYFLKQHQKVDTGILHKAVLTDSGGIIATKEIDFDHLSIAEGNLLGDIRSLLRR